MEIDNFWKSKNVLITGHTGFKGSWLSLWLLKLGANVSGISLPPDTFPSLFDQMSISKDINHFICDIRDFSTLNHTVQVCHPDIIFHLAAQPLVRRSYEEPALTWAINVLGTINLLEVVKAIENPCSIIIVTTDKCYENKEWVYGYRETDFLGGCDPYSSSKAAVELAVNSWKHSYLDKMDNLSVATVRAGNVIGAGDWSIDRIVPDVIRSLNANQPILLRNPHSTRPWQHVLEPLRGYLLLAQKLYNCLTSQNLSTKELLGSPFNFGPDIKSNQSVQTLVLEILKYWPGSWEDCSNSSNFHEARLLNLSIDKAYHYLGWFPIWNFEKTVAHTITTYRQILNNPSQEQIRMALLKDIETYESELS